MRDLKKIQKPKINVNLEIIDNVEELLQLTFFITALIKLIKMNSDL